MERMKMAEKLMSWRKDVGKTQREAAEMLGVCVKTYSRYEKGQRDIPEEILDKLLSSNKEQGVEKKQEKPEIKEAIPNETRLCSFKIKSVRHPNGDTTQWFLPCLGARCMSYQDGVCTRIQ